MKVIIAGSRSIMDEALVFKYILESKLAISEVVSGTAYGVDSIGEKWAFENNIPIKQFPAKWDDFTEPSKLKLGKWGPYNALAGFNRNQDMAKYADAAIIIIKDYSSGSQDMLERMNKLGKPVYHKNI